MEGGGKKGGVEEAGREWRGEVASRVDLGSYGEVQEELVRAHYLKGFKSGDVVRRKSRSGVSGAAIGNRKSWQWVGRSAGVVRSKPRYVEPGARDLWLPLHTLFVVFVFVVFVCVYWRQCLYHPVGTPSGWLPGERRSNLRLGRHL